MVPDPLIGSAVARRSGESFYEVKREFLIIQITQPAADSSQRSPLFHGTHSASFSPPRDAP